MNHLLSSKKIYKRRKVREKLCQIRKRCVVIGMRQKQFKAPGEF